MIGIIKCHASIDTYKKNINIYIYNSSHINAELYIMPESVVINIGTILILLSFCHFYYLYNCVPIELIPFLFCQ